MERDNGPRTLISVWVLMSLATVFLIARVYAKASRSRGLWWDDHVLIASWLALLGNAICLNVMINFGFGKPQGDIPVENLPPLLLLMPIVTTFSILAAVWSKTSFAAMLLRLTDGWMMKVVWFTIVTMNLFMGLSVLFNWIRCTPFKKGWQPWVDGTCWDIDKVINYHIFSGAYSAAADFGLSTLPWLLVRHLQMQKKEKLGVAIAMSLGIFAGATAVVKCYYIPVMKAGDTYTGVNLSIWGTAESATTIIATSIPVLRVFIRDVQSSMNKYHDRNGKTSGAATYGSSTGRGNHTGHGNNTVVVGGDEARAEFSLRRDDRSDKSILGHGKIMKTDEIAISFQDKDRNSDMVHSDEGSYEMGRLDV